MKHVAMLIALAGVTACARAGGEPTGGEITEAGALANTEGDFTGDPYPDVGTGTKWSDLYRDYFAATELRNGQAVPRAGSCSFKSTCHGSPDGAGAKHGAGIQCFDEKGCRLSLFAKNLVTEGGGDPDDAKLFGVIRRYNDRGRLVGYMPKEPGGYYSDVAIARMRQWIADGAKDD